MRSDIMLHKNSCTNAGLMSLSISLTHTHIHTQTHTHTHIYTHTHIFTVRGGPLHTAFRPAVCPQRRPMNIHSPPRLEMLLFYAMVKSSSFFFSLLSPFPLSCAP